ncbi:MAG: CRISPR-associated endonuclease Cas2 [Hominenteromicrobium sp.]
MLVLVTYDVNTETSAGRKRLRRVAKTCTNYGQRVQNSVFECIVDAAQSRALEQALLNVIDPETDSLRLYFLGNRYETKVHHHGTKVSYPAEGTLIL